MPRALVLALQFTP